MMPSDVDELTEELESLQAQKEKAEETRKRLAARRGALTPLKLYIAHREAELGGEEARLALDDRDIAYGLTQLHRQIAQARKDADRKLKAAQREAEKTRKAALAELKALDKEVDDVESESDEP